MFVRKRAAVAAALAAGLICPVRTGAAGFAWGFESGLDHNAQPIRGSGPPGLYFRTPSGGDVYFADINSGSYSVTSDNGKAYKDGNYFVSGDVAAYVLNPADKAEITVNGPASYFTVGYSSEFSFVLEAYGAEGGLLTSATGPANTKSQGGTGLSYLTVSVPGIAYVVVHDQGGHWMIDNISTDGIVPEPSSFLTLISGLVVFAGRRRTRA